MNRIVTLSAAVLTAFALAFAPGIASASTSPEAMHAKLVNGTGAIAPSASDLVPLVGMYTSAELGRFGGATSVDVFRLPNTYTGKDIDRLQTAMTDNSAEIAKLRTALSSDTAIANWFKANKVQIKDVVAVSAMDGKASVYLQ
ncbi:MAG TPA: hypothetical protein VIL84_02245 [Devosiaceae bacterium]